MLQKPFYDPEKTYEENLKDGPFGYFADKKVVKQKGEPQYNFFGHKVYSPFGIPAGPLINGKFVKGALNKGFDIVTYKTVRSKKFPCHKWPNILSVNIKGNLTLEKAKGKLIANHNFHEPLSITNSFGVPSLSPKFWQKDIANIIKNTKKGQIVVGAFQGIKNEDGDVESYINDFRKTAKLLKESGVKVFEVNLSCPNEGTANLLCFDTNRSVDVARAIKKEIGKLPLIVKIAYFNKNALLKDFVKQIGKIVDGISAINTIASSIVDSDGNQALPGENRLRCGVCGYSIKWAGLDMVKRLKKIRQELNYKYTIIGVGGVTKKEDFKEYRKAGADIVMSATGAMWNPYLAEEIKNL
ncbi:MAG: dihydroorotate oxidase [Candidatus Paceibacterota bacterium]|jgi:dihydroorotate dehydrogenase